MLCRGGCKNKITDHAPYEGSKPYDMLTWKNKRKKKKPCRLAGNAS